MQTKTVLQHLIPVCPPTCSSVFSMADLCRLVLSLHGCLTWWSTMLAIALEVGRIHGIYFMLQIVCILAFIDSFSGPKSTYNSFNTDPFSCEYEVSAGSVVQLGGSQWSLFGWSVNSTHIRSLWLLGFNKKLTLFFKTQRVQTPVKWIWCMVHPHLTVFWGPIPEQLFSLGSTSCEPWTPWTVPDQTEVPCALPTTYKNSNTLRIQRPATYILSLKDCEC